MQTMANLDQNQTPDAAQATDSQSRLSGQEQRLAAATLRVAMNAVGQAQATQPSQNRAAVQISPEQFNSLSPTEQRQLVQLLKKMQIASDLLDSTNRGISEQLKEVSQLDRRAAAIIGYDNSPIPPNVQSLEYHFSGLRAMRAAPLSEAQSRINEQYAQMSIEDLQVAEQQLSEQFSELALSLNEFDPSERNYQYSVDHSLIRGRMDDIAMRIDSIERLQSGEADELMVADRVAEIGDLERRTLSIDRYHEAYKRRSPEGRAKLEKHYSNLRAQRNYHIAKLHDHYATELEGLSAEAQVSRRSQIERLATAYEASLDVLHPQENFDTLDRERAGIRAQLDAVNIQRLILEDRANTLPEQR